MMLMPSLARRVTRDLSDGLLVIDGSGSILCLNDAAAAMLGLGADAEGTKYVSAFSDNAHPNDEFHQFVLDAVYDKQRSHAGTLDYTRPDGSRLRLAVKSHFLMDDAGTEKAGVSLILTDVTELERSERLRRDSAVSFAVMMGCLSLWCYLYILWETLGRPISDALLTQVVHLMGVFMFVFLLKKTSISLKDMGLGTENLRHNLRVDGLLTLGGAALMIGVKLLLLAVDPALFGGRPFFDLGALRFADAIYPLTVVFQEFICRGVIHESLRRIFTGRNGEWVALVLSTLAFGALHMHKGLIFMLGAVLLLFVFGLLYRKQNSIWGLCVPHYVLGELLTLLFSFA